MYVYIYIYIYTYKLILFLYGAIQFALHSTHSTSAPSVSLIGTHLQYYIM